MEKDFWKTPLVFLKKVGPKKASILDEEIKLSTFEDLLHYFPRKYVDKSQIYTIRSIQQEGFVTLMGRLGRFDIQHSTRSRRLTTTLRDNTGYIELTWFQGITYIANKFKENDEVVIFGKLTFFNSQAQISHPDIELLHDENESINLLKIIPQYRSTEKLKNNGLDSKGIRQLIYQLLETGKNKIEESLSNDIIDANQLIDRASALQQIHFPENFKLLELAKRRLKFEELFFFELVMAKRKYILSTKQKSQACHTVGNYFNRFYKEFLPFELTNAQKRVIREIRHDLAKTSQMNRLVQGDVGSGKTMVAIMSILIALDSGFQAALMAPTEILAEQHFHTCFQLLSPLGIQPELLVGKTKVKQRRQIHGFLQTGQCQLLIGTHALIEDAVQFNNLGLTIIDEQHKFGVLQRSKLWNKARPPFVPHNLVMTATPIPRTLAMSVYGDVNVSVIDELPPGRKEIKTVLRTESYRLEVFGWIKKELTKGRQAYIVYPLVEESSKMDLLAVTDGFESIARAFPNFRVGIVHGKMKPEAKEYEMQRFKKGETHILVSTTVIEVGVDVPNATIMVIENAERFGLSQLHQLRGRVGRGGEQSYCILITGSKVSYVGQQRLKAMEQTTDGFKIAQIDLELRGPGDFLGTRQSGLPDFKLADIVNDQLILEHAKNSAYKLIENDPNLENPQHATLLQCLLIFIEQYCLQELIA